MRRILVVDDDAHIRDSFRRVLRLLGYHAVLAEHGAEALALLASDELPAVIVTDLVMPVMDGWAFLAALRRDPRLAEIPTVVWSGSPDERAARLATAVLPNRAASCGTCAAPRAVDADAQIPSILVEMQLHPPESGMSS